MALHPAPPTSCSGYRTTPQESFIKLQDDHTLTVPEGTALVAGGATHLLQVGRTDVQDSVYVSTVVSQSAHQSTQWHSVTAVIGCSRLKTHLFNAAYS